MKKLNAVIGTLAAAGTVMANVAVAATSTTTVKATAPRLIDKLTVTYFGAYSGPSIGNPNRNTTNVDANGILDPESFQNLDSTLTAGYKFSKDANLTGNYRFIYTPATGNGQDYTNKDPWLAYRHGKIINGRGFNLAADFRLYAPVQTAGKMNTAFRSTQIAAYQVPNTRLTLGTFTIVRANFLKESATLPNAQFYGSAFGSYQLSSKLSATAWSDILQYDYRFDKDLQNKLVLLSLGVNWDVTPKLSVNPSFNFFPGNATLERTTLGLIISATIL